MKKSPNDERKIHRKVDDAMVWKYLLGKRITGDRECGNYDIAVGKPPLDAANQRAQQIDLAGR